MAIILITHDLGVVARMADEVMVMYAGKVVEKGSVDDIFYRSGHPYTQGLRQAMPTNNKSTEAEQTLVAIDGHRQIYSTPRAAAPITRAAPIRCRFAHSKPRQRATSGVPNTVLAPP